MPGDDFFDDTVPALSDPSDFFGAAADARSRDFFNGALIGIAWNSWADTEYTMDEINQNGLVTMEDFD